MAAAELKGFTVDIATRGGRGAPVVRPLHDVHLRVPAGRVTALIGESGCGKSLVAAALCGLLPPGSRTQGRILIGGEDLSTAAEARWRPVRGRGIGFVPQSAATSFTPVRTVGAQLAEVCRRVGADRDPVELLAAAQLPPDTGARYPHELSGGMAQRAAIAAAIAARPPLLIADEPTSALDPGHAGAIWALLGAAAASGAGVLAITHDLMTLADSEVCDDVAFMRDGTVVAQGPWPEITDATDDYSRRFFAGVRT